MTPRSLLFAACMLSFSISAIVACDESSSTDTTDGDGGTSGIDAAIDSGTSDAPADASTEADLYPDGTTKIVVTATGGFVPPAPDGSVCNLVDTTYTIVLPARELSWKVCERSDAGPNVLRTGQKTLSASEYAGIDTALHALTRTTEVQCGADAPSAQITFTTPSGDVTYYDDFYFCDAKDQKIYVSGIGGVMSAIRPFTE